MNTPQVIRYQSIVPIAGKNIIVNSGDTLNFFEIQRIYWIIYNNENKITSEHAHKTLRQMIIAISGVCVINLEDNYGKQYEYTLKNPSEGLYIPPMHWKKITFENGSTLLCLASEEYKEEDYIRDYTLFKQTVMQ